MVRSRLKQSLGKEVCEEETSCGDIVSLRGHCLHTCLGLSKTLRQRSNSVAENRCVVYQGPGEVTVEDIGYPKLEVPEYVAENMGMSREAPHGAILRIVSTNICGSDQHMVRGRTTAPEGQTLGHEITGEVIEKGNDVQFINEGDLCSVPFNIACGRCRNCRER